VGYSSGGRVKLKRGPLFWVTAVIGWGFIGWGLRGIFLHHVDTRPTNLAKFFLGGALVHDLIFAPLVILGGYALSRVVPASCRTYVQVALIISGVLALVAYPEVRDYARILHNPTSLPHNYTANLAVVVGAVWAATACVAVIRRLRRR
jgi:hypothetical protein